MKTRVASTVLFCVLALTLLPRISAAQSGIWDEAVLSLSNEMHGGSVGTRITFNAILDLGCALNAPVDTNYTASWDFGSGATPATVVTTGNPGLGGVSFSQNVTYSTTGVKTVTLTVTHSGGYSATITYGLYICDCGTPSIPRDAIVISSDTTVTLNALDPSKTYWVNPGIVLNLSNLDGRYDSILTIFAEPGSTVSGGVIFSALYMKHGSVLNSESGYNCVVYGDGASISTKSSDFTLNCPTLDFDYSNAPPNAAFPSSAVSMDVATSAISIMPNPTNSNISIADIPQNVTSITVLSVLGTVEMNIGKPNASNLQLDLGKLSPGVYYVRFAMPGAVVTKRIVKE